VVTHFAVRIPQLIRTAEFSGISAAHFSGVKDMKKLSSLLLAAVLSVGLVSLSHAKTTDLGTLSNGTQFFYDAGLDNHFTDYVNFDLSSAANIDPGFVFAPVLKGLTKITDFSLSLESMQADSWINLATFGTTGTFKGNTFSFANLMPGNYRFVLDGVGKGMFGGGYLGGFNVTSAVPEAETWAMLLVGFGLIAYQLRRKQRTLLEQQLAA
jgi:hypothetical protein